MTTESGEHRNVMLTLLTNVEKKLDMLIGMMKSSNQRLAQLERRMSAYDGQEVELISEGNGAAEDDGE